MTPHDPRKATPSGAEPADQRGPLARPVYVRRHFVCGTCAFRLPVSGPVTANLEKYSPAICGKCGAHKGFKLEDAA